MKKSISILILLSLLAGGNGIHARELTLDECVAMALENNARMRVAEYNVAAAEQTSGELLTKYFPSANLTAGAFNSGNGILQHDFNIPLSSFIPGTRDVNLSLGFVQKGAVAGVNLIQPVFMGGRIVNANRLSRIGENVSHLQKRQTAEEVRMEVEGFYWQIVMLRSKLSTLDKAIEMLDTLTSQVRAYVDAGVTTSNSLLEVELRRNEMAAARTDLENGLGTLQRLLSQYIGAGIAGDVEVSAEIPFDDVPPFPFDIYRDPEECVGQTVGYGLLEENVKAKELEYKIAVGNNLPMVAAGAGYNYEYLLDQWHSFPSLYVMVSIPITDWWGGSYGMKRKRLEEKVARTQLEDNAELLQIAITNAWNDLTSAYTQISTAREAISQSAENLRLNRNYYSAGTVTVTDLLDAQTLHCKALDRFVEAYGNFQMKKLIYLQSTGHS